MAASTSPARITFLSQFWFVVLAPALIGYGLAWLSVYVAERYGLVLFLALPFVVCFGSAFLHNLGVAQTFRRTLAMAVSSLLVLGALIFLTAMDGLTCLVMALPLALLIAIPATALGSRAGRAAHVRLAAAAPIIRCLMFPVLVAFEDFRPVAAPLRSAATSVFVAAPAHRVWDVVVAFPRIKTPPSGIFRCGIACPVEARIEGVGVGAVRYCTFTTGDFVEPVTAWKPGELLAFDVTSSPLPMEEFSLYEHVDAPHLHGHLRSHRGQFRIVPAEGGVVLEATTWYSHEMWPQWYWAPMSDWIIHQIHHRVLDHIKISAESLADNLGAGVHTNRHQ